MGGPSVQQFTLSPGVHVTPVVDYTRYDWNSPGSSRRAVYRFVLEYQAKLKKSGTCKVI